MLTNRIGGTVRQLDKAEFYNLLDFDLHDTVARMLLHEGTTGMVVFENLDLCSSQCGNRSFMVYGPSRENKVIEDLLSQHLGDVPSRFQYPVAYYIPEPV